MTITLDIEARLKELESILGQTVILADQPEEESECLLKDEKFGVAQTKEGEPASIKVTLDRATPEDASVPSDSDELDEMGNYRDAASFAHLKAQDLSDEDVPFCPWKVIKTYPECFTGKANRPRVKIFFDNALNYRDWNFFYIRDTRDPKKAHLLVPTQQLQNFFGFINKRLSIDLRVPRGPPGKVFYLRFAGCGAFRPRYLLHHRRSAPAEALAAAATRSGFDIEDPRTWPRDDDAAAATASKDALAELKKTDAGKLLHANMALLRRDPKDSAKLTAGQRFQKRQGHRKKEMQTMLSYIQLKEDVAEKGSDVVFFCVDVEAIEVSPGPVSEIGIAILDMQRVGEQSPGNRGRDWWPLIEGHHLRIKEYSGLKNYRFVQGCPDDFQFGTSTFPPMSEALEAVRAILRPYLEDKRRIVLAGHAINQDVGYMGSIGFDLQHETQSIGMVDSQSLYQGWTQADRSRSLGSVLDELGFAYGYLHNAGNDAVYTLRAAIGVAFASTEPASPP